MKIANERPNISNKKKINSKLIFIFVLYFQFTYNIVN